MNLLSEEKSPYLQQHAHNPVDWMPWGEAAFEKARREDKPIFLSIGYSTCHWCHVMERESFENDTLAALMNEYFVNVKVDREERPDVDRVYMTFIQATNQGQGGWPMSVFLTPDLRPFYGGTYYPPRDAYGRPGFSTLLQHIASAWRNDRTKIEESGEQVVRALQSYQQYETAEKDGAVSWADILSRCYSQFAQIFDSRYGGFGDAPKFPRPVTHDFLHRCFAVTAEPQALEMSRQTLSAMARGGMHDHLGGGFHRYAVDAQWVVSHFEKMLYDQAQLVVSLLEMVQLGGEPIFATTARSTLEYVLRDMTHPEGGFYSAEDADSYAHEGATEKEEGAFYVWTQGEIEKLLGDDAALFCLHYGVRPTGNAPAGGDPHGEFRGKNILLEAHTIEETVARFNLTTDDAAQKLEAANQRLLEVRNQRPRPHRDEKIIVAWNGLMISAFAQAASVLNEPRYLQAAQSAAEFIRSELWDATAGTLRRHYMNGAADVAAFADDYAFLMRGLLDLYQASGNTDWLEWTEALGVTLDREFWDEREGAYFNAAADPHVLLRMKEDYDGAEPTANSIATLVNLRLAQLLERPDCEEKALRTLQYFGGRLAQIPSAMPELLCALLQSQSPPQHIVIVGGPDDEGAKALREIVAAHFLPFNHLIHLDEASRPYLVQRLPFVANMTALDGRATAYVCRDFACRAPVNSTQDLQSALAESKAHS